MEAEININFRKAFELVINGYEGKYSNDKDDPGGETYKGIARNMNKDFEGWLTGFISFQYEKGTNGVNAGIPAIKGALNRLRDENIYEYAIKEGFVRN